jgi:hypothetical protein
MKNSKAGKTLPKHIECIKRRRSPIITAEGKEVAVWELSVPENESLLSGWAKSFREHYCLDSEIDALRTGTGLSRKDYLINIIFPDKSIAPGPSIRAGDFAEILVNDYLEYILDYWVPREKYAEKATRNESIKGVDTLGFFLQEPQTPSAKDTLIAFEVKAQLTGNRYLNRLQDAIKDSSEDLVRRAYSLNATKRRLRAAGNLQQALIVQRFQNPTDHPYTFRSGAAAVLCETAFNEKEIAKATKASAHKNSSNLELLAIRGKELMSLVHSLYERAAHEA